MSEQPPELVEQVGQGPNGTTWKALFSLVPDTPKPLGLRIRNARSQTRRTIGCPLVRTVTLSSVPSRATTKTTC